MFLFSEILRNKEDIALIKLIENNELKDYREDLALFSDQNQKIYQTPGFDIFLHDLETDSETYTLSIGNLFMPYKTGFSFLDINKHRYLCYFDYLPSNTMDAYYFISVIRYEDFIKYLDEDTIQNLINELICLTHQNINNNIIFDNLFDLMTVSDKNGVIIRSNSAIEKEFGVNKNNIIGMNVYELEETGILSISSTKAVLETQKPITLVQNTKSGKKLLVSSTPIFDANGKLYEVVNISRDITTIDSLESKLRETEDLLLEYKKRFQILIEGISNPNFMVTSNIQMQKIMDTIEQITAVDTTVMIEGETGVGKTLLAKKIHDTSNRKNGPFIKVNCGAIPDNLLESELFGYEKGAFTGALNTGKKGLVAAANEGTLFLDEIGDLSLNIQAKVLDLIQSKLYYPIGAVKPEFADIRIIAATNKNLKKMVNEETFREDLFYRLNVIPLYIPPLIDRRSEISILANHFVKKFCKKYHKEKYLSQDALNIMINATWPGNIRELENMIERLVVTTPGVLISKSMLPELLTNKVQDINAIEIKVNQIIPLKEAQKQMEKALIDKALELLPNKSVIAEVLGVHRTTISRKTNRDRL